MPSSVIRAFEYDDAARALTVTFTTSRRYRYRDVPPEVVRDWRGAVSKGRYFNARVRDRYAFDELG